MLDLNELTFNKIIIALFLYLSGLISSIIVYLAKRGTNKKNCDNNNMTYTAISSLQDSLKANNNNLNAYISTINEKLSLQKSVCGNKFEILENEMKSLYKLKKQNIHVHDKPYCLLIEDDPLQKNIFKQTLSYRLELICVTNVTTAKTIIFSRHFDIAIVDYKLDVGSTGLDFIQFCWNHKPQMLTTHIDNKKVSKAILYSGYNLKSVPDYVKFIPKPIDWKKMHRYISELI